jgi:alkaline phosphatase D
MAKRRAEVRLTRRRLLATAAASSGLTLLGGVAKPSLSFAPDRPRITHGVQSGDVGVDSAVVWARADRPARMLVEVATTPSFHDVRDVVAVDALPETDCAAKVLLDDLPAAQDIFYRIAFQDLSFPNAVGEPQIGRFRTAPADRRSVSFTWSGDSMGQGWGIDPARGGMRTYGAMLRDRPDFFIHCGDIIYADCPIPAEVKLPDGQIWKSIVTEEKSKVAETHAEFRGNYKYNLLDENLRAFNAEVPVFAQWDDHEVIDDWWPGQLVARKEYRERSVLMLAARGRRAFNEFMPVRDTPLESGRVYRRIPYGPLLDVFMLDMRSYRGPNGSGRESAYGQDAHLLGPRQVAWLKRELVSSRATWKVIASDLPIGLVCYDGIGQGDGAPGGRELEIADLLSFMHRARVCNTVWITADVHYTAAHHYDPNRAAFQDFMPFWEFVSGPLHAGTGGPAELDNTFGPRVVYQCAATREQGDNVAPCFGLQFFGQVAIDGRTEVMTVALRDVAGQTLWSTRLEPTATSRLKLSARGHG